VNLTVDIGGIRIGLDGLPPGLEAAARERYALFLSTETPHLALSVEVVEGDRPEQELPLIERRGERSYGVQYRDVTAEIDLEAGRGRATCADSTYRVDSLLRICTTLLALEQEAVLLHSSGVRVGARGEQALICFGPSGVGKTTVARSVASEKVLCDEMMLVRVDAEDRVTAAGTPFHGDLADCRPGILPVAALVRLRQGDANALTPLSDAAATHIFLNAVLFFSRDEALAEKLLALALRICHRRTYTLTFQRDTHVPTFVEGEIALGTDVQ
jgi:hypothetical protein